MKKLILLPYKKTSVGSRMLANAIGVARVGLEDEYRSHGEAVVCLNWGRGDYPWWRNEVDSWINEPTSVMRAIDKKVTLQWLDRAKVPGTIEHTESFEKAGRWIREGHAVMCRKDLQGQDGSGIVVARELKELVPAQLYTKYVKKVNEYRVHVMNGEAFYVNIKRKTRDAEVRDPDPYVRTSSNGWIFVHLDEREWPSKAVLASAIAAVEALGLDFGGVDVGESQDGTASVYEVNTAPEMGPNTTAAYKAAFQRHYGEYKNNENIPLKALQ